ncbi:hypothetical protein D3C87_1964100 [compost metagenome]
MGFAYIGNDSHIGRRQSSQQSNLAARAHPHLQDRNLNIPAHGENRQRKTDMVIEIPLGFVNLVLSLQQGCNHILRGGFPIAAGNGDHLRSDLA